MRQSHSTPVEAGEVLHRTIFYGVVLVASAHFCLSYATLTSSYVNLVDYLAGEERLPFQYRALTAWLGAILSRPGFGADRLAAVLPHPFDDKATVAFLILNFCSMALALIFTSRSILHHTGEGGFSRISAFIVSYMAFHHFVIAYGQRNYAYPYDLPQLALFCIALHFLITERQWMFLAAFTLATLNRETSIFLAMMFGLFHLAELRSGSARFRALLAAQVVVYLTIRYGLFLIYGDNPVEAQAGSGGFFVEQWRINLANLLTYRYWPNFLSVFGFGWILILLGWRRLTDARLKRCLYVVPVWAMGMFLVGKITEIRVFGELIALMAPTLALVIHGRIGQDAKKPTIA